MRIGGLVQEALQPLQAFCRDPRGGGARACRTDWQGSSDGRQWAGKGTQQAQ